MQKWPITKKLGTYLKLWTEPAETAAKPALLRSPGRCRLRTSSVIGIAIDRVAEEQQALGLRASPGSASATGTPLHVGLEGANSLRVRPDVGNVW
jgi:hypothetical protein